jgi:hypothetical protein
LLEQGQRPGRVGSHAATFLMKQPEPSAGLGDAGHTGRVEQGCRSGHVAEDMVSVEEPGAEGVAGGGVAGLAEASFLLGELLFGVAADQENGREGKKWAEEHGGAVRDVRTEVSE